MKKYEVIYPRAQISICVVYFFEPKIIENKFINDLIYLIEVQELYTIW